MKIFTPNNRYSDEVIQRISLIQSLSAEGHSTRWIAKKLEIDREVVMSLKKVKLSTKLPSIIQQQNDSKPSTHTV